MSFYSQNILLRASAGALVNLVLDQIKTTKIDRDSSFVCKLWVPSSSSSSPACNLIHSLVLDLSCRLEISCSMSKGVIRLYCFTTSNSCTNI